MYCALAGEEKRRAEAPPRTVVMPRKVIYTALNSRYQPPVTGLFHIHQGCIEDLFTAVFISLRLLHGQYVE